MAKLDNTTLNTLYKEVAVPAYDRTTLTTGIVHFGVGGFHRAHQAMYLDRLMSMGLAHDWGICGVGIMENDLRMRDILKAQDGLYTLMVKHPNGHYEASVIGSIIDYKYAPENPEAVIELMASPAVRIVSLTITEGGYNFHQMTGAFDFDNPQVKQDLAGKQLPVTVFGFVTEALARRKQRGITPFTIMSCDNIQSNGDVAKAMFCAYAKCKDPALGAWIDSHVAFPNAMVDRITPMTTKTDIEEVKKRFALEDQWPVVSEPFTQWVIEDNFSAGCPPYEKVGVQIVPDVVPYELMKLRLLNASHQALAYFGYLAGYRYVHDVCQDSLFSEFLLNYMQKEGMPTLAPVPGIDLNTYCHTLIERFSNPEVRDTLARLCAESSDRIPKWLVPVIQEQLAKGGDIHRSAAVVASWARYAEGIDEQGQPIEIVDRLKDSLMQKAVQNRTNATVFIENRDLFGDLIDHPRFVEAYAHTLAILHTTGAREALKSLI